MKLDLFSWTKHKKGKNFIWGASLVVNADIANVLEIRILYTYKFIKFLSVIAHLISKSLEAACGIIL